MLSAILMILAGFVVIGLIIVANAYFVAQEFSFMSVDRTQLRTQAAEGDKTAQRALAITQQTSFMLSGAQLGITVTGLLVGYVAEPVRLEAVVNPAEGTTDTSGTVDVAAEAFRRRGAEVVVIGDRPLALTQRQVVRIDGACEAGIAGAVFVRAADQGVAW